MRYCLNWQMHILYFIYKTRCLTRFTRNYFYLFKQTRKNYIPGRFNTDTERERRISRNFQHIHYSEQGRLLWTPNPSEILTMYFRRRVCKCSSRSQKTFAKARIENDDHIQQNGANLYGGSWVEMNTSMCDFQMESQQDFRVSKWFVCKRLLKFVQCVFII